MLRAVLTGFTAAILSVTALAQHASNAKPHTLTGKVTEVGKDKVTVDHDEVKGYMGAMTMPYKVDKLEALSRLKVGDRITATVYDADYTLYDIKVVPAKAKK